MKSVSISYLCPTYLWTKVSEIYGDSGPSLEFLQDFILSKQFFFWNKESKDMTDRCVSLSRSSQSWRPGPCFQHIFCPPETHESRSHTISDIFRGPLWVRAGSFIVAPLKTNYCSWGFCYSCKASSLGSCLSYTHHQKTYWDGAAVLVLLDTSEDLRGLDADV